MAKQIVIHDIVELLVLLNTELARHFKSNGNRNGVGGRAVKHLMRQFPPNERTKTIGVVPVRPYVILYCGSSVSCEYMIECKCGSSINIDDYETIKYLPSPSQIAKEAKQIRENREIFFSRRDASDYGIRVISERWLMG